MIMYAEIAEATAQCLCHCAGNVGQHIQKIDTTFLNELNMWMYHASFISAEIAENFHIIIIRAAICQHDFSQMGLQDSGDTYILYKIQ